MKKLLCILLSVILITGTGVISANAIVNPDTHMASISARLQDELADSSTDTVQMVFYLYDYTSYWEMNVDKIVNEKYNVYADDKDYYRYYDLEMSTMIIDYNYAFGEKISKGTSYSVHVNKVNFYSQVNLYVVVEAQKDKVEQMAKDYTDVESMDLFDGYLPDGSLLYSPFQSKFEQWAYINERWAFEIYTEDTEMFPPYYTYSDLYVHNKDGEEFNPDWVLCRAKLGNITSPMITWLRIGGIGGRTVINNNWDYPFMTGYGVYDVKADKFYGLEELTEDCVMPSKTDLSADNYDGLTEALAELNIGYVTGDANKDNKVDILDSAFIQKIAAGKASIGYNDKIVLDVNRDNTVDILDSTIIQKALVAE